MIDEHALNRHAYLIVFDGAQSDECVPFRKLVFQEERGDQTGQGTIKGRRKSLGRTHPVHIYDLSESVCLMLLVETN